MKILLADDHGLFRDSMAVWLDQLGDELEIDFSSSFNEVQQKLAVYHYDLILLDLGMPDMQGVISIGKIHHQYPATPVMIVSADERPLTISACIDAGVSGYVVKSASGETILRAIKQVLSGRRFILTDISHDNHSQNLPCLSDKQKQILVLIIDGHNNKTISETMHLSEGTVKQYISRILSDLQVDNRTQAANIARELLGIGGS